MKELIFITIILMSQIVSAQTYNDSKMKLILDLRTKADRIQSTLYGLFIEDINLGVDGGLYPELVKNRSFDFPQSLMGWYTFGNVSVKNENPAFNQNPNYLEILPTGHWVKPSGIENEGFRGMGFKKDTNYNFTIWAKNLNRENQKIQIELINSHNDCIGKTELEITSSEWKKYDLPIKSTCEESKGKLRLFLISEGGIAIDHVSLFPSETFKNRKNGLRKDLVEALQDLKPGVFRFPGGCIVEGADIDTRYDWKKSIGSVENRPVNENRWHYTFHHRFTPDYYQTYGLGFYEYFVLSEDIGAEPLPVVSVGLACQHQNNKHVPLCDLEPFIQDALDLVEFANGDTTTRWGKERVKMGHSEPFNLKYIGIGNEQWGKEYTERLELFVKAFRKKCPDVKIIGSSGPWADGEDFDYLWPEMKRLKVDLVDEHYYKDPQWFLKNADRYDGYNRKGPAVFAGEYAAHATNGINNFQSALSEAAFMTGLERNADIVHMTAYAPLLAHVDGYQWRPDLIWFDNLRIVKTPNYYIQQLFSNNKGTHTASLKTEGKPVIGQQGVYASAVYDEIQCCYILKIVNTNPEKRTIEIELKGILKKSSVQTIQFATICNNPEVENTLDQPDRIIPQFTHQVIPGNEIILTTNPYSLTLYKVIISK